MLKSKLPKLSELDKGYQEFILCVLRAHGKAETEAEYHRQMIAGLDFESLWLGKRPIKYTPKQVGVLFAGTSGQFHRPGAVWGYEYSDGGTEDRV